MSELGKDQYKNNNSYKDPSDEEDYISFAEVMAMVKLYWGYIWKFRWVVIVMGVLGGAIGLASAFLQKVNYTAHYSFSVNVGSGGTYGVGTLASLMSISVAGSGELFSGDNVLELLQSRELVDRTLLSPVEYEGDTITFMEYALIVDSVRAKCEEEAAEGKDEEEDDNGKVSICDVYYPYGQARETLSRVQDSLLIDKIEMILKNSVVAIRRDKKLAFMDYDFTYPDERFAKEFAKAHLKACTEFYIDMRTQSLQENIDRFQGRADSIRRELNSSMVRRAVYLDENRNASGLMISSQSQKIEMDIQVLGTTYAEIMKNIEALKLDLAKEKPLITVVDKPRFPLKNDKKRKLKSLVAGGFLGGVLACLAIVGYGFVMEEKKKTDAQQTSEEEA